MKKFLTSLPAKLLLGIIVGIVIGLVVPESVMAVLVPIKNIMGQVINFIVPVDRAAFDGLPVVSISIRARFVDVTLRGNPDELYSALTALGPAVIDELPPDFEDTFITDVKGGEDNA